MGKVYVHTEKQKQYRELVGTQLDFIKKKNISVLAGYRNTGIGRRWEALVLKEVHQ